MERFIEQRLNRRSYLRNTTLLTGTALIGPRAVCASAKGLSFREVERGKDAYLYVPPRYQAEVLIRWSDPVLADAPAFNPLAQSGARQRIQFGYNNDFVAYRPLPPGSTQSAHRLLCVNHEFTHVRHMFPANQSIPEETMAIEMAAHDHSILEVARQNGPWQVVPGSAFARRIDADTPIRLSAPAADHDERPQTEHDPNGMTVLGTLSNCGGVTPWGSILSAEAHFQPYFQDRSEEAGSEIGNHLRYGVGAITAYNWFLPHPRFRIGVHTSEPNQFRWVVEIAPYNPHAIPVKQTALGRFSHEAATCVLNPDARVVVYMGDDQEMKYIYRYVSRATYRPDWPDEKRYLLDDGDLSVTKFDDTGLDWRPLVFGLEPLTPTHGFHSQADVLIETRGATDLLNATPTDRSEDIETNPVTNSVFVRLTGNRNRPCASLDDPNPRRQNGAGHIIESEPPGGDHTARRFAWHITLLCGDPRTDESAGRYSAQTSHNGFSSPDNCTFNNQGRIWVTSDASPLTRFGNGSWVMDIETTMHVVDSRHLLRCQRDAERCGPAITPHGDTTFAAIQHPGLEAGASYESPTTRGPDFDPLLPPRPSIVAITQADGAMIGT